MNETPLNQPESRPGANADRPIVIAMANQKGGVGKTTTTVNLAACLAVAGRRCLVVDIDPQANATSGLGVEVKGRGGTHYALLHPEKAPETVRSSEIDGLDVLGSHPSLQGLERDLLGVPDREIRLKMALSHIQTPYHYVLIDCPPSLSLFPANAFACSDFVLVPLQCEYYAMEGLAQILAGVEKAKQRNPRLSLLGIVLTMFDPASEFAREVAAEVRSHFGETVYSVAIPRDVILSEAPSHAKSVLQYDPRSRGARGYVELARELMAREKLTATPSEVKTNEQE